MTKGDDRMKKALIGGFLGLIGTLGLFNLINTVIDHLVNAWTTPPGRLISTLIEYGMVFPAIVFLLLLVVGLWIMAVEFFAKEPKE